MKSLRWSDAASPWWLSSAIPDSLKRPMSFCRAKDSRPASRSLRGPAPELGVVRADPGQVEQVIVNQEINKSTPMAGTRVTFNFTAPEDGTYVRLTLSDGPAGCAAARAQSMKAGCGYRV